ncbi:MAG: SIMPL domain-containing protein [Patescibacteria group bacterium]
MNNKILSLVAIITLTILSAFLLVKTNQTLNTATTANTVSFSGEGKVIAKPDTAVISASIVTEAKTSKVAQDENSAKSNRVTVFLKEQKIDEKDIKTTAYNIYPQYNYRPNTKPEITGYQVNQTLEIKVRDLDKISTVLDGLVSAGTNQVNNLGLKVDDPEKLKSEARTRAIVDAKAKAKELEKQVGIQLGKIVNFSESYGGIPSPVYYSDKGMGGGGGGPTIPTGENEIFVNVTLTYQIK